MDFSAESMCLLPSCLKLLGFRVVSSFCSMVYLILNIGRSDLRMVAWNVLQTCLGVPAVASFRKKMKKKNPRKRPIIFWRFNGLWSVRTRFRHQHQSLVMTKKVAMSPSSTVHGGQYDTKYLACNIRIDGGTGIRGEEIRRLSWTSSYQPRDSNTRSRTRRYSNLLDRILRASFVLIIAYSWSRYYNMLVADVRLYKELLDSINLLFRPKATWK